jgi:hypothetical protein
VKTAPTLGTNTVRFPRSTPRMMALAT